MQEAISPISGQAILTLLLQLAGMLLLARALAEVMRRLGQPAVIGELLAGIVLGPTLLGHFAPGLFELAFPPDESQRHLLEIIAWLGMVLLLLLTGIETDIRAMRNLGRAAFMASVFGMVVPFATGLALGWLLPDAYLTDPDNRPIFALFLATAMAISAMPVIAKILLDLDLIAHRTGIVILSAAVVDDTIGWLILSVIAGIAAGGVFSPTELGITLLWLGAFLAGAAAVRKAYGLRDDLPTLLVLSGGFGMGPVAEILAELDKLPTPFQTLVVAGRNEELRRELAAQDRKHPTHVLGFVRNMHELMTLADLLITKPGGLTTSEALALGRPLFILNPIPGQEAANSDFLLQHGAAEKANRVEDLPYRLGQLLGSKKHTAMAKAAKELGQPAAAAAICREVVRRWEAAR